jgi:hypothetical protein
MIKGGLYMKVLEDVKLNEEIEELAHRGIHKGYEGTIAKINGDIYTVWFFNPKNYGEFAFAEVNKKYLIPDKIIYHQRLLLEMEEFLTNVKMEKYSCLTECDVKEYDAVELIVEKPKYSIHGVHKGDRGCVISTYAIDNQWEIIFSERGTGKDIAQIGVDREDFKIIE